MFPRFQSAPTDCGAHAASCSIGRASVLKQLGCEAGHSLVSGAEVKNGWGYNSTSHSFLTGARRPIY